MPSAWDCNLYEAASDLLLGPGTFGAAIGWRGLERGRLFVLLLCFFGFCDARCHAAAAMRSKTRH